MFNSDSHDIFLHIKHTMIYMATMSVFIFDSTIAQKVMGCTGRQFPPKGNPDI